MKYIVEKQTLFKTIERIVIITTDKLGRTADIQRKENFTLNFLCIVGDLQLTLDMYVGPWPFQ